MGPRSKSRVPHRSQKSGVEDLAAAARYRSLSCCSRAGIGDVELGVSGGGGSTGGTYQSGREKLAMNRRYNGPRAGPTDYGQWNAPACRSDPANVLEFH